MEEKFSNESPKQGPDETDYSYIIIIIGPTFVQQIEKSIDPNFGTWLDLANSPRIDKESIIAVIKQMIRCVKTSKEVRKIFSMVKIWSDLGHDDYSLTISEEIDKAKITHKVCVEVLEYYYHCHPKEDQEINPLLKIAMMKKALITSDSLETFLNSNTVKEWSYATKVSLQGIKLSTEKWWIIINSPVSIHFREIARERIKEPREEGLNHQLPISQT